MMTEGPFCTILILYAYTYFLVQQEVFVKKSDIPELAKRGFDATKGLSERCGVE